MKKATKGDVAAGKSYHETKAGIASVFTTSRISTPIDETAASRRLPER
jgi:hypothetical protein